MLYPVRGTGALELALGLPCWRCGIVVSIVWLMNEVTVRQAQLVLG